MFRKFTAIFKLDVVAHTWVDRIRIPNDLDKLLRHV